jgi:transposase
MSEDQRLMLVTQLNHIDFLSQTIEALNERVEERLGPFEDQIRRLDAIPGVGRQTAQDVIAEIGVDMSSFPTVAHLCSWAKVCPGSDESAGKRRSGSTGKGNRYIRAALADAAWAASHSRKTYFGAQVGHRRGKKRAIVAVSNSILGTIYYMLRNGTEYHDLGPDHFDEHSLQRITKAAKRRLEQAGWEVHLELRAA